MATFRESPINRALLTLISRWRGEAAAIQTVRRVREVSRFSALFVGTILLPALLLAYFALSSIRSEELSVDADLRTRAAAIENQVQSELNRVFEEFETQLNRRIEAGGSPLSQLRELSPFLQVAFRTDRSGQLIAPFSPPLDQPFIPDYASFRLPWRAGVAAERAGSWSEAAQAFAQAQASATHDVQVAEAAFAAARAAGKAHGDPEKRLADVYADFANTRDRNGFRIGDLVLLTRAEMRLTSDPETGAAALQDLVTDILDRRWTLGVTGEPTIARRALASLPRSFDPDWAGRAHTRLNQRTEQLRAAERVANELELLATSIQVPQNTISYQSGPNSTTLWAITTINSYPTLFAFDLQRLLQQLNGVATLATRNDPDLVAKLFISGESSSDAIVERTLHTYLPFTTISVEPADPQALLARKSSRRRTRIGVVLISVFLVFVGVVFAARVVQKEVENARMKADFAANVSHELRSPITQIRLKAEALQLDLCYNDEDRLQHYDAIVRESERLSRLVDNVLDFAAIERGAKRYSFRDEDIVDVVRTQLESVEDALLQRGLRLEASLPSTKILVRLDREALGQVLINLLSNAAKYGRQGEWVGVVVEEMSTRVEIAISDRGIGISAEELPNIFDDFFRSTDPKARREKGTGIGLAIVRYIVEAHGGTISVESEPDVGSTFILSFPFATEGTDHHAANPVR